MKSLPVGLALVAGLLAGCTTLTPVASIKATVNAPGFPFPARDVRTLLLASGAHARVVQELMRHSDIKLTTKLYTMPRSCRSLPASLCYLRLRCVSRQTNTQKNTTNRGLGGSRRVTGHRAFVVEAK